MDSKDYERFKEIGPEWLRNDILSHIQRRAGHYFFENAADGSCAMLDRDGLCRIQRNTSEEMLCNTCRKYPRLINSIDGVIYLSMAASCPVISSYLIEEETEWYYTDASNKSSRIEMWELAIVKSAWRLYQDNLELAKNFLERSDNNIVLYSCFEQMVNEMLDMVLYSREKGFWIEVFQVFEEDQSDKLTGFLIENTSLWNRLVENYMKYRVISRKIELPGEADEECVRQAQGELFLLRTLLFSRYVKAGVLIKWDFQELLQKMYRFCAHGEQGAEVFHKLLDNFFSKDILWSYVLL